MFTEYSSVMEDVNDLEDAFGYYRPMMDDDTEEVDDTPKRKRGRPPKDPSASMTAAQKADRRALIVEAVARMKAKRGS